MPNNSSDWWAKNKPEGYIGSPDLPIQEDSIITDYSPKAKYGLGFMALPNAGRTLRNMAQGMSPVSQEDIDNAILDIPPEPTANRVVTRYTPAMQTPKGFEDYYTDPTTDFTDKYNTQLTPEQETKFQDWVQTLPENQRSTRDYDLRGYFLAGLNGDENIKLYNRGKDEHFLDRYKKPNHPTFSDESIYHGVDGFTGGHWENWGRGKVGFVPSNNHMMDEYALANYFKEVEPRAFLYDPRVYNQNEVSQGNGFVNFLVNNANKLSKRISKNWPVILPQAGGLRG